jgi:hypothetical protein
MRAFVLSDLVLLIGNILVDHGPKEGLKRIPEEAGVWPPTQRRQPLYAWVLLFAAGLALLGPLSPILARAVGKASKHPAGRFLNLRPVPARWSLSSSGLRQILAYNLYAVAIEECYIHGLLWSRMAWLGGWRPLVNALAWAGYHLNRPVKDMVAGILPGAILASYVRSFTGNLYWNALGHYLSNVFWTWFANRNLQKRAPSEETSVTELISAIRVTGAARNV